jgi:CCR4-NOT transcription complex subunit 9
MAMFARAQTPQWQSPSPFFTRGFNVNAAQYSPLGARGNEQIINQVKRITSSPQERGEAIHLLSVQRESIPNLGTLLWESPAAIAALLSEIIAAYPHIASITSLPPTTLTSISTSLMSRVCNAMTLFQSVAGSADVRSSFLKANIPLYLIPFLHTTNQSTECDHFKLAALGIVGTIAMSNSIEALRYLLNNDFLPICLRILKFGQEIHKILAAYIMQRILSIQEGREALNSDVVGKLKPAISILNLKVLELAKNFDPRLSRNIVIAYEYVLSIGTTPSILKEANLQELRIRELHPKCDEAFVRLVNKILSMSSM